MLYIIYKVAREISRNIIRNTNLVRNKFAKEKLDKAVFNILVIKPEVFNTLFLSFSLYILNPV